jgi:hypothetical protein
MCAFRSRPPGPLGRRLAQSNPHGQHPLLRQRGPTRLPRPGRSRAALNRPGPPRPALNPPGPPRPALNPPAPPRPAPRNGQLRPHVRKRHRTLSRAPHHRGRPSILLRGLSRMPRQPVRRRIRLRRQNRPLRLLTSQPNRRRRNVKTSARSDLAGVRRALRGKTSRAIGSKRCFRRPINGALGEIFEIPRGLTVA